MPVNHELNRGLLLEAIHLISQAKKKLDQVSDYNGQTRYFKAADKAYGIIDEAIKELTVAASTLEPQENVNAHD